MPKPTLGERIRQKRKKLRMSQEEIAEKAKISRPYLSQIESGSAQNVSVDVLVKLAMALEVTTSYLIGEVENHELTIDPPLFEYAEEAKLNFSELVRLDRVPFRGERPQTKEEWKKLHEAIIKALGEQI